MKENSNLNGKRIIFLGSSITQGSFDNTSFVEYLAKIDGIVPVKEAVSGTTLAEKEDDTGLSYVDRIKTIDIGVKADLFVCQLSTNDASQQIPIGSITGTKNINDFNTKTVVGAIEYIIAYSKQTWNCPIVFFTNPQYESVQYAEMVKLIFEIQKKWDIGVIDLWNSDINNITEEERQLYMIDKIHPSKAGYLLLWTPIFEKYLSNYLQI